MVEPSQSPQHVVELGGELSRPQHQPFVLAFKDLTYRVKAHQKSLFSRPAAATSGNGLAKSTKTLLDSISGEAREGEITAVLGASGSGKSTLIDALANRISKGSLKGDVTLNGEPLADSRQLKAISAYVMQDDLLFPMLTVEETLMFASEFRLPRSLSAAKKRARVEGLIDQLGLRNAAKTIIGDEGRRGVSGGERRRVSIGIEIIHDPIILFLDEPMSGLDSTSAFMVVKVLQRIAQSGSIVMMSVHQPSSRIMGLLDRLIFLSRGRTVFNGPPDDLRLYFSLFGRPIPENENHAEFTLDLIREMEQEQSPVGIGRLVEHNKSWQLRNPTTTTTTTTTESKSSLKDAMSRGKLAAGEAQRLGNSFGHEVSVLTRRSFTNTQRMPELFAARLGTVLITGFFLATVYFQLDATPKGAQERLGFFAFAMCVTFYTCADTLPVFLQERYIFMRETAYNAYRRSSYVLANALASFPVLVVLSIAFSLITFFPVGLDGGASGFGFYFAVILASFWAGSSFVTFLSGVLSNVMLGYTVVVAVLAYYLLLSGFFINRDRIPDYWLWFHYMSLVKYPYEAVLINEFDGSGKCFARGTQIFDNSPVAGATEAMKQKLLKALSDTLGTTTNVTATTCLTTGAELLQEQSVTDLTKWNCLWITVAWGFLFRILFYFALLLGSKNKRK